MGCGSCAHTSNGTVLCSHVQNVRIEGLAFEGWTASSSSDALPHSHLSPVGTLSLTIMFKVALSRDKETLRTLHLT
jgi:hypothetical protein